MRQPTVSVVIPAYNQAEYLGMALRSVLDQSFTDFEVLVVDDGSRDGTREVVAHFSEPRVQYLAHAANMGASAARNSGLRAAAGELVAFLDADDFYRPDKLEAHVAFLREHLEVGGSYNARFEIDSSGNYLALWRPPATAQLRDLVLGFPFNPSDLVLRKEWVGRVGLLKESYTFYGDDLHFHCALALAGCKFAGIDRPLGYRRYYPGRLSRNPRAACETMAAALEAVFADAACPSEVRSLRNTALGNCHLIWAYDALAGEEPSEGQEMLRLALRLNPSLGEGSRSPLLHFLLHRSTQDGGDHEDPLRKVFARLPEEMKDFATLLDWAVGRGYLIRGARAAIWQRPELASHCLGRAAHLQARPDGPFLRFLVNELMGVATERGAVAGGAACDALCRALRKVATKGDVTALRSQYLLERVHSDYRSGRYSRVPVGALRVVAAEHAYVRNVELRALFATSAVRLLRAWMARF